MKDTYNHYTFTGGGSSYNNLKPTSMQMSPVCTVSRSKREDYIANWKRMIETRKDLIRNAKKTLAHTKNPDIRAELENKIAMWEKSIMDLQDSIDRETKWIEHERAVAAKHNEEMLRKRAWLATTGKNGKIK